MYLIEQRLKLNQILKRLESTTKKKKKLLLLFLYFYYDSGSIKENQLP